MQFLRKTVLVLISLLASVSLVTAQDACPAEVTDAVFALNDICTNIGRNQACYGNGDIVAIPQSGVALDFTVPGDVAAVDDIESLSLSPFEATLEEWGIAVLVIQASLPDTLPGQNVTMLLFGDVTLSNDENAYYFTSGIGTPTCNQAPNGILIQTPEGAGQVNLTLNGIDISLGSTAYLSTFEEDILTFALLEGDSSLSIDGSEVELDGEEFTTIELDDNGNAVGEFTEPESIEELDLPELPLILLPEAIGEDEVAAGDTASVPSEVVTPLSGDWLYTLSTMSFGGSCPSFLNEETIRQGMGSFGFAEGFTQELIFVDEVDIQNLFNLEELAAAGMTYTFDNSEPNIYVILFTIPGAGSVTYTWRILSEIYVEGEIVQQLVIPDLADCTITSILTIEYQD